MKRSDWRLIIGAAVFCLFLMGIQRFWSGAEHPETAEDTGTRMAVIRVNGEESGRYALSEDQTIQIGSTNLCVISEETVWMEEADCPDQTCVKQGRIRSPGEIIVCLPNRVTVQITASEDAASLDAVAN